MDMIYLGLTFDKADMVNIAFGFTVLFIVLFFLTSSLLATVVSAQAFITLKTLTLLSRIMISYFIYVHLQKPVWI